MIKYFRRMLVEPIRTVEEAEETVKLAAYGLYTFVLTFLFFVWLTIPYSVPIYIGPENRRTFFSGLILLGLIFFMNRIKSRILALFFLILSVCIWISELPLIVRLSMDHPGWYEIGLSIIFFLIFSANLIVSFGATRGTLWVHWLQEAEKSDNP